jgi:hypothetical protein
MEIITGKKNINESELIPESKLIEAITAIICVALNSLDK